MNRYFFFSDTPKNGPKVPQDSHRELLEVVLHLYARSFIRLRELVPTNEAVKDSTERCAKQLLRLWRLYRTGACQADAPPRHAEALNYFPLQNRILLNVLSENICFNKKKSMRFGMLSYCL